MKVSPLVYFSTVVVSTKQVQLFMAKYCVGQKTYF